MQRDNRESVDWGWEPPLVPEPTLPDDDPQQGPTNGLARASLVLGLFGICFLAVPLAMIALAQIRNRGQQGRVLALAALAASGCYALAGFVAVALLDTGRSAETTTQNPLTNGRVLSVGDCVSSVLQSDTALIPLVSCDQPHAAEVITEFPLTGPWPGRDESARRADSRCTEKLTPLLIGSPMVAELRSFIYFPANEIQWRDNPKASCAVMRVDGGHLTTKIPR